MMKRTLYFVLALLLAQPLPSLLHAQQSAIYGKDTPRFDVSVGYERIQANAPPGICNCFGANGGYLDFNVWLKPLFGVVGQFTGAQQSNISSLGQNLTLTTFMGGPRFMFPIHRVVPYGEFLLGAAHGSNSYFPIGNTYETSASSFAYAPGGGVNFDISRRISVRLVEAHYLHTSLPNGTTNHQNQLQIGAGIVFRFGHVSHWASSKLIPEPTTPPPTPVAPPTPPPPPPSITDFQCTSGVTEIQAGSTVSIASVIQTSAGAPDVTYSWSSSGGNVMGSGSRVTVDTTTLPPGEYHVTGHAQLGSDSSTVRSCDVMFRVLEPVKSPDEKVREFKENVHDIFFALNKWALRPEALATLEKNAEYLKANPDIRFLIDGFADERGPVKYNLTLGEKRANAVRDELLRLGISADRMQIVTFGHDAQTCTAGNEKCWQQNRRVGFIMQP